MTREQYQKEALELINNNKHTFIQWATGMGKSKLAIDAIRDEFLRNKDSKVLLVVAELAHKKNWELEFKKFNLGNLLAFITIDTYASLKKHAKTSIDFLILDEGHHIGSTLRLGILTTMVINKSLVLSATLPEQVEFDLGSVFKYKVARHTIPLKLAIKDKILPIPDIILIPLKLDNREYNQEIIVERGKTKLKKTINIKYPDLMKYMLNKSEYPNIKLVVKCTQKQKYLYLDNNYNYWKRYYQKKPSVTTRKKWLQQGLIRKKFLGESKTDVANIIIDIIKYKRFICFASTIEQSLKLGNNVINSKVKDSLKVIDKFNNGDISNLIAVGMLQEGQNLADIEIGLIIQLDGYDRSFIQKLGRVLRAKNPIQIILYYSNTQDEEYLNRALKNIETPALTADVEDLKDMI